MGPASASPEKLKALLHAGADTFRLNFSHGAHADHAAVHAAIRVLEEKVGRPIGILQDLQGPKIRIGTLKNGGFALARGQTVRFVPKGSDRNASAIPLPHPEILAAVLPGHEMLMDDGRVRIRVTDVGSAAIEAAVLVGGRISSRIVGWSIKARQTTNVVLQALLAAVWRRKPKGRVRVHSDQGRQFTSMEWASFLKHRDL